MALRNGQAITRLKVAVQMEGREEGTGIVWGEGEVQSTYG
jgi:hypothetical protein